MSAAAAPVFVRSGTLPLWWLDSSQGGVPGVPGYRAGYVAALHPDLPERASLDEVWQNPGGAYLFVDATPSNDTVFAEQLTELLQRIGPGGQVRLLWIPDPAPPWTEWQVMYLQAQWTGAGPDITWTVASETRFDLGAYALTIGQGTTLAPAADAGIALGAPGLRFTGPAMGYDAQPDTSWLPLSGAALGCWRAGYRLPANGDDNLALLGVQLRYATADADGNVVAVPMPVLQQRGDAVDIALGYDPLNPEVRDRTQAEFVVPGGAAGPVLGATLITALGYGTTLSPMAASPARRGARLVFGHSPQLLPAQGGGEPLREYHLAPDGAFVLGAEPEAPANPNAAVGRDQVVLGTSGLEYVELPLDGGAVAFFDSGHDAFAPAALSAARPGAVAAVGDDGPPPPLTGLATTSYLTFLPAQPGDGFEYYAQPKQAPLYAPPPAAPRRATNGAVPLPPGFLEFVPLPAGTIGAAPPPEAVHTGGEVAPVVFPVGVYAALPSSLAWAARAVEEAALAPARRAAITAPSPATTAADATPSRAVTPQGLVGTLAGNEWAEIQLANLPGTEMPDLTLTRVRGPQPPFGLLNLLQSNQLFAVVANPDVFMAQASVRYRLTAERILILLQGRRIDASTAEKLRAWYGRDGYRTYETEPEFLAVIPPEEKLPPDVVAAVLDIAGLFKADLQGWTFQLSPRSWRATEGDPTLMLFKYCNRSLADLVADPASWGWPQAAVRTGSTLAATQELIQRIFTAARQAPDGSPEKRFYDQVVNDATWNGTLFLNAPVSLQDFPVELQFVLAGVDTARFFAHHVGFSLTPFRLSDDTPQRIEPRRTAAFGLIRYSDPTDLVHGVDTRGFAFKTLALSARFANAALADFSAQVELLVTRLFGDGVTKVDTEHGNNLVLDGSVQRQNGAPTYAFTLRGSNLFRLNRSALQSVEVLGVQLQTSSGSSNEGVVTAEFVLNGNLRFDELYPFDLFSFGPQRIVAKDATPRDGWLRFGNLAVAMSFPLGNPGQQSFRLSEGRVGFDVAASTTRPGSLVAGFPLQLSRLVASPVPDDPRQKGQKPEDLGFTSVSAPIDQALLSPPWYGLVFTLDLGTVGALAGSAGMSVELLAAWAPGAAGDERPLFLALKLPSGPSWPLQGVLRLSFRSFQFTVSEDTPEERAYMLRMHRFALSLLGWSFPPGTTDVLLFGNPNPVPDTRPVLGWYAAYSKDDKGGKNAEAPTALAALRAAPPPERSRQRRLQAGRRRLPPPAGV
jgi:hypothetical protein